jgi:hypothetical protein
MSEYIKKIKIENAVGTVLAHDMTRIVPGQSKGAGFKKGHIVKEEDIAELRRIGKKHLYILELPPERLHEDEAALRIASAISGEGLRWTQPAEGKSSIISPNAGLVKIDRTGLQTINGLDDIIVSTLRTNFPCKAEQIIAATRIIPLTIAREKIEELEQIASHHRPVIQVKPFRSMRVGGVVTGSEIYEGLVTDGFDDFVGQKIIDYGCDLIKKIIVPDEAAAIADAIRTLVSLNCELIVTTGGLSVDPDDVTRQGIRDAGAGIEFYGSPVLPGAMFLYAHLEGIPILGLPACVYYHPTTMFDLMLPRILAGDPVTKADIAAMGHGGLCLQCEKCRYPVCPFG